MGTLSGDRIFPVNSHVFGMQTVGETLVVARYEDKSILYYRLS